ncbi:EC51a protein [Colletotrichum higginsianum IMI 349063]|uniref:EC51a protein n=1 Tax=Colletotrichum higginsianum (strain IMI 349063) TaxID=759273 RepID=A0A1B7XQN0_COLHI|nr:EC51a protein [Colletotrichum higginsianum IMI 349063]OBR02076.1 EC51a protein [Colletotrichum higginsianum IMI 349063]
MRFLYLLSSCVTVAGLAVPKLNNAISVRAPGHLAATGSVVYDKDGILSRDSSAAWTEAEKVVGTLRHNTHYYFMSCNKAYPGQKGMTPSQQYTIDQTGCLHVGLIIGKTAFRQNKFTASYLHVRRLADNPNSWTQTSHDWDEVKRMQRIDYGGTTTSSKGNIDRVMRNGKFTS